MSAKEVKPGPSKTAALADFPFPKDLKGMHCFPGSRSYCRGFNRNYARTAEQLQRLSPASARSSWGSDQDKALPSSKRALVNAMLMAHPEPRTPSDRQECFDRGFGCCFVTAGGRGKLGASYCT